MTRLGHARPVRPQVLRGWIEFAVSTTNAPAGLAAATGDAPQPEVTIAPNAGLAAGTGTAEQPEATIAPNAGAAAGTGAAPQATAHVQALAGVATAIGEALQPTVDTGAEAAPPKLVVATPATFRAAEQRYRRQATAQFVDLGGPITPGDTIAFAGLASATGQAFAPIFDAVRPWVVVATDTAHQAAQLAHRKPIPTLVDFGAPVAEAATEAPAGLAAATGSALAAKAGVDAKPNTPEAAGTAPQPTVQTGAFTNAPAGLAAATGTANAASVTIRPNAGVGLAAGVANQPEAEIGAKPGFGLAAGIAPQPTVAFGSLAQAGLAAATGTANQPEADIRVLVGVAAGTGEAFGVFGLVGNPLGNPQGITAIDDDHSLAVRDPVGLIAIDDDHSL